MTANRPAINNSFFELAKLWEFEYVLNAETTLLRVEIFQSIDPFHKFDTTNTTTNRLFRGRIWELVATKPISKTKDIATNADRLMVDRTWRYGLSRKFKYDSFYAKDLMDAALKIQEDITYSIWQLWSVDQDATLDYERL